MAKPTLQEPIFLVDIQCPSDVIGTIYESMAMKWGSVETEIRSEDSPMINVKAFLPVAESFGFTSYLWEKTNGKAFMSCMFDHWEIMNGDALDPKSKIGWLVCDIRKWKGLKEYVPDVNDYRDKL